MGSRPSATKCEKKIAFFTFCLLGGYVVFSYFFVFLPLLLFLALSCGHSSLSFAPPTAPQPTKLHTRVAHIPPPLLHLLRLSRPPPTPETARVPPPHPSFCFPLGPISKGCSTTACSAVGAGMSKIPPQPPYLSPPSISLTLTSLFLFGSQKKAQHFPAWKVVRLPQDPPRSPLWVFWTFSCSAVFPLSPPTLLHALPL